MIRYPEGLAKLHLWSANTFRAVYIAMLLLAFQGAVTLYVHSTFLEQFLDTKAISAVFLVGAGGAIAAFFAIPFVLRRYGNFRLTLGLIGVDFFALLGMGLIDNLYVAIALFIVHQILTPLFFYTLDIFLENLIGPVEDHTGGRRGIMLTIMSFASAVAPLLAGTLLGADTPRFDFVYVASAFLLLPFGFFIYKNFSSFKDARYKDIAIGRAMSAFWHDRNLRSVFCAHFLLQLFFAWMVIYLPLYLATEIGFGWDEIGGILFVGLLAYVLLEYPIGYIADRWLGEQEMMAAGFLILAVSTAWLSFVATAAVIPWMVTMFLTRVGASFVETTTEGYFFKHATGRDADTISFFRVIRPLAILVGALFGSIALAFMPFQYIFVVLGLILALGIIFSLLLVDTK